jgi:uroporphyrinogen decarboxylase
MTGRERVLNTIKGKPVDRRPFSALLSLYGARLTGCPLRQYYTDAAAYADGQSAVLETFQPDILFAPFLLALIGEAFGSELVYFDNQPPNLLHPAITSAADIPRLKLPGIDTHPRIVYTREALARLVNAHGKEVSTAAILLSPADLPLMIMGVDGWMETVFFNKDGVKQMLDLVTPFFLDYANALLEDGADMLVLPAALLTPELTSREMVNRFTIPVLRDTLGKIRGPVILHNVGSPFLKFLDSLADLPNVTGIVMNEQDNLHEAREKIGAGKILIAGPDGPDIGKTSAGKIKSRCTALLNHFKDDPRFILATSGPDVPIETPPGNIHALRRAVDTFDGAKAD